MSRAEHKRGKPARCHVIQKPVKLFMSSLRRQPGKQNKASEGVSTIDMNHEQHDHRMLESNIFQHEPLEKIGVEKDFRVALHCIHHV